MLSGSPSPWHDTAWHTLTQIGDGGDSPLMWRLAANVMYKQSQAAGKEWFSSLAVGQGTNNSSP